MCRPPRSRVRVADGSILAALAQRTRLGRPPVLFSGERDRDRHLPTVPQQHHRHGGADRRSAGPRRPVRRRCRPSRSPTLVITSPSAIPAAAAGPPSCTFCTCAPSVTPSVADRALTPIVECCTVPVRMICSATSLAMVIGIAKPRPIDPLDSPPEGADRGVDPDHRAGGVDQRAAGVARVDRGVGLHGVDHRVGVRPAALQPHRAVLGRHDAGGHRAGQAERRADRDHRVADGERRRNRRAGRPSRRLTSTLTTARSVSGSRPDDDARHPALLPSLKITVSSADGSVAAVETTWLLVRM